MVFAKETNAGLTSLVKKLDAAVVKNKPMCSFVVLMSDEKGLEEQLKKLADREKIEKTVLTIDNPGGPKGVNLDKDADVTVVFYLRKQVKASHSLKSGELTEAKIDQALAEGLPKIVTK
jgi:hypothetical protein